MPRQPKSEAAACVGGPKLELRPPRRRAGSHRVGCPHDWVCSGIAQGWLLSGLRSGFGVRSAIRSKWRSGRVFAFLYARDADSCLGFNGSFFVEDYAILDAGTFSGSCTATDSSPSGEASPEDPLTVCCTPI